MDYYAYYNLKPIYNMCIFFRVIPQYKASYELDL